MREVGLDQLKFARLMTLNVLFFLAANVFPSELSDARIALIQNMALATGVDDFFDVAGSREELKNLIALIEKYNIFFNALGSLVIVR